MMTKMDVKCDPRVRFGRARVHPTPLGGARGAVIKHTIQFVRPKMAENLKDAFTIEKSQILGAMTKMDVKCDPRVRFGRARVHPTPLGGARGAVIKHTIQFVRPKMAENLKDAFTIEKSQILGAMTKMDVKCDPRVRFGRARVHPTPLGGARGAVIKHTIQFVRPKMAENLKDAFTIEKSQILGAMTKMDVKCDPRVRFGRARVHPTPLGGARGAVIKHTIQFVRPKMAENLKDAFTIEKSQILGAMVRKGTRGKGGAWAKKEGAGRQYHPRCARARRG
ncbi:hypothetical protein NFJ02_03g104360 [Pycnococcus provasolii]